ncbi:MAG: type II toxin-antitoxin system RelE/ParE family toxin [Proteobacteria bacterium]|nr:type II toxin-antitoxin system RelE/ParE family toxin [Pseudomonadota bacterium]
MTAKPVALRELAHRDVEEALEYHLTEAGLEIALRFIDGLERVYSQIGAHPEAGSSRYAIELSLPQLRSWTLGDFPYLVFYAESEHTVDVWRVLHGARDIPNWMREGAER